MRHTFIQINLFLLFLCFVASASAASPKDKVVKKKSSTIQTPEPDVMVQPSPKHKNLPDQAEASTLDFTDLLYREGIDVSHYQGDIDWDEVARNGKVGYAFMKATEGAELEDDYYEYNIREARRAGLKVGSYHFFRANAPIDMQFANMTSNVKKEMQDMLPIIDVEHTNGCNRTEFVSRLKDFMQRITAFYGRKPILYTFVNFYNKYLEGEGFDDYPLMIAFYRDAQPELNDGRKYMIWQYSSHGDVPGVRGNVDRSVIMDGFTFNDFRY